MEEVVQWLLRIEQQAGAFYKSASEFFADDPVLSRGLEGFANDENWHRRAMVDAAEYLRGQNVADSLITGDPEAQSKIEAHFKQASAALEAKTLTRRQLYEFIVSTEYSEWNDMFQYVVNTLKGVNPHFKEFATQIQAHKRAIAYFMEHMCGANEALKKAKELPPVWTEKILIIEDDEAIADLIMAVLEGEGEFHVASNGQEAIDSITATFYKLIISDVNMPVTNGLECYRQVSRLFPNIRDRYLFITGDLSDAIITFFRDHQIAYLKKPVPISEIKKAAMQILLRQTVPPLKPMASPV